MGYLSDYYKDAIALADPSQDPFELSTLIKVLEDTLGRDNDFKPAILEIGVDRGGTLRLWKYVFNPRLIIGVDSQREIRGTSGIEFIQGDSHSEDIFLKVNGWVQSQEQKWIDFLFIDGDHTYEGVKKDFEMYKRLVHPDEGVIAFHDVMLDRPADPNLKDIRVCDFWREIKNDYTHLEIWNKKTGGTGTGVIWL